MNDDTKKSLDWVKSMQGDDKVRIDRYLNEVGGDRKVEEIVFIASLAWNAKEVQLDIGQGLELHTLADDQLRAYWYYFQKADRDFEKWSEIETKTDEEVMFKIDDMIEKVKLEIDHDSKMKNFIVNRRLSEEEKRIFDWKYSSGPVVIAKTKKHEMEVEKEEETANIEMELRSIRDAHHWNNIVVKEFKLEESNDEEIQEATDSQLIVSAYWNQQQDSSHIKFSHVEKFDRMELVSFATTVRDWMKLVSTSTDLSVDMEIDQKHTPEQDHVPMDIDEKITVKKQEDYKIDSVHKEKKQMKFKTYFEKNKSETKKDNYSSSITQGGMISTPKKSESMSMGINVNLMATTEKEMEKFENSDLNPPPINQEEQTTKVEMTPVLKMKTFTARFEIGSNEKKEKMNIPIIVKQVFRLLEEADRTYRLLPFYSHDNEDIESIDQEESLPVEEKAIKKWIDNPHFNLDKLRFAMRVTTLASKNHIRDTLYPWMSLNKSFLRIDDLHCSEIHCIECIVNLHTTFYNRFQIKRFIVKALQEQGYMGDINMYVRNVWNRSTKERVVSRALVIEVDKKFKEQAIDAMIAIDLNSEYRGAKFIRFNKTQFDAEIMNNILK